MKKMYIILLSLAVGFVLASFLYLFSIDKVRLNYSKVDGPEKKMLERTGYVITGGWPMRVTNQVQTSKIPSGPLWSVLAINVVFWSVMCLAILYLVTHFLF